jgi:hypothetical protein
VVDFKGIKFGRNKSKNPRSKEETNAIKILKLKKEIRFSGY